MAALLNIVMHEPEIPQNVGNIARLCACTNARLILVGKLGFSMSDKYLKRSGLDYWDKVEILKFTSYEKFLEHASGGNIFYFTTKGKRSIFSQNFNEGDFFVFGSESKGLPKHIMELNPGNHLKLPMAENIRSLNLSNTVAVSVYEAIRQINPNFC